MTDTTKPVMRDYFRQVLVCVGSKCCANGEGEALYAELKTKLKQSGLEEGELRVIRSKVGCLGTCRSGPLMCIQPDGIWYYAVDNARLDVIIERHLLNGEPVNEWIYHRGPGRSLLADDG